MVICTTDFLFRVRSVARSRKPFDRTKFPRSFEYTYRSAFEKSTSSMKMLPIFGMTVILIGGFLDAGDCRMPNLNELLNSIESFSMFGKNAKTAPGVFDTWRSGADPDLEMTTPEIIRKEGYPAEAHVVLTDDGYLLTMHRIPAKQNSPTVFLQHGLLASSSDWVIAGKGKSLAFILSDHGYDVWMGNARGNTYSKSHVNYTTSDVRFWNFSWHEMANYDLPAEISYITKMKKGNVAYIGHSMGTTMFYAMAIDRPDIASKVNVMFALAPVAFMNHLKSPVRLLVPFIHEIELIIRYLGQGEFLPQNGILKFLARYGCDIDATEEKICANSLFVICGFDASEFNYTLMPIILSHTPAGASTKTIVHYGQEISSGRFQRYDYGSKGNMKIYNSTIPPDYDLSKINVPIGLFWSENDWLASPIDVKRLYDQLPKKILNYKVDYPKFNHLDFLWAIDAPKLVYDKLLNVISNYR